MAYLRFLRHGRLVAGEAEHEATNIRSGVKRRQPFHMTGSPRAAAWLTCLWIVLGLSQVFLTRSYALLWLRIVLIVGYALFAVADAITLINLRRHPELARPCRAWWM